jgi:acyl-CoA thioesterase-1
MMQSRLMATGALAIVLAAGAMWSAACGSDRAPRPETTTSSTVPSGTMAVHEEPRAGDRIDSRPRVVFLGDSLTAGLGLAPDEAYPALIQQRIDAAGLTYQVVNAGVSGDTSAGGLSRLDWALEGDVRVLVVALGGNDGLRGLPPEELRRNLSTIIERAQARKIAVILAGMEAPPNFGQAYIVSFHQIYPELAKQYGVPFIPFLLQDVAGIEGLNQRDGIHPTAEGARTVAENVWSVLRPTLKGS